MRVCFVCLGNVTEMHDSSLRDSQRRSLKHELWKVLEKTPWRNHIRPSLSVLDLEPCLQHSSTSNLSCPIRAIGSFPHSVSLRRQRQHALGTNFSWHPMYRSFILQQSIWRSARITICLTQKCLSSFTREPVKCWD